MDALETSVFDEIAALLQKKLPRTVSVLKGLRRLETQGDLSEGFLARVQELIAECDRREALITGLLEHVKHCKAGVEALVADGFPDLPVLKLDVESAADLEEHRQSMLLALGQFTGVTAVAGHSVVGPQQSK